MKVILEFETNDLKSVFSAYEMALTLALSAYGDKYKLQTIVPKEKSELPIQKGE